MSDGRGFYVNIAFNETGYMPDIWKLLIDQNIVKSDKIDFYFPIVMNQERDIGGVYNFQVFEAVSFETPKNVKGYYLVGNNSSSWSSKS